MKQQIRIGLTHAHPCSYLVHEEERVAIAMDEELRSPEGYEMLLNNGFRRSGETIYTPHCETCQACQSIRVNVNSFSPSKSQKRVQKQLSKLQLHASTEIDPTWFKLYEQYINARHRNGSMYPPKKDEFITFAQSPWLETQFLHIYEQKTLIAVAVTDVLPHSLSAFYTFFAPDHAISLGSLGILAQLEMAKSLGKEWLYLGYQIDECPAMSYKVRFQPHQRLVNRRWQG